MFIFAKHNFVEDYLHATGTGDNFLKQEMINDQIAKLIIEHKGKVVKALRDNGIDVKTEASNQKVADAIIANVEYNKALVDEINNLVMKYNIPAKEFTTSVDATIKPMLKDPKVQGSLKSSLSAGISDIGKKKSIANRGMNNGEALKERIRLAEMQMSMLKIEGEGMSTGAKIGIGIGIGITLVVLGFVVFKMIKKKGPATAATGGTIANAGTPAPGNASAPVAPGK